MVSEIDRLQRSLSAFRTHLPLTIYQTKGGWNQWRPPQGSGEDLLYSSEAAVVMRPSSCCQANLLLSAEETEPTVTVSIDDEASPTRLLTIGVATGGGDTRRAEPPPSILAGTARVGFAQRR